MKQKWHPYSAWEDYINGMWRKIDIEKENDKLDEAIRFTGDAEEYGAWMLKVAKEWPIACEHNLTDTGQNRRAWIGHAAACMAINCPEYITRKAWGYLSKRQQKEANEVAEQAISWWERNKCKDGEYAQELFVD